MPKLINFETSRKKVMDILKGKVSTVTAIQVAIAMEEEIVDATPVIHGKWITRVEYNNGERIIAACSNCKNTGEVRTNRSEWGIWHIDSPYCPNCGSKMDER